MVTGECSARGERFSVWPLHTWMTSGFFQGTPVALDASRSHRSPVEEEAFLALVSNLAVLHHRLDVVVILVRTHRADQINRAVRQFSRPGTKYFLEKRKQNKTQIIIEAFQCSPYGWNMTTRNKTSYCPDRSAPVPSSFRIHKWSIPRPECGSLFHRRNVPLWTKKHTDFYSKCVTYSPLMERITI